MEEYSSEFSTLPDIGQVLRQRIAAKKAGTETAVPTSGFDPHKLMVKKHKVEIGEELPEIPNDPQWPDADVKALQDYCQKMGIVGFSSRQHPRLALMKLKQNMGDFTGIPLENRSPMGYQPISPTSKKTLLNG